MMTSLALVWHASAWLAAVLLATGVGACSVADLSPDPGGRAGLACVDDSKNCIEQRTTALKSIMDDRERKWVKESATPEAYASGVRLFAFKARKKELTCEELVIGRREAEAAAVALRGPASARLTPAQVSRGVMLGAEVSRELTAELKRRCNA
jgi:hypothetical protein